MCCLTTLNRKKNLLLLFTKNQPVGLWLIVHVTTKFFNNYVRVLMSKFRLDGLNSGELCYLYIYGKKMKITNMKSNGRLTKLNCNDFIQLGGNESITHLLHRQFQLSIKTTGRPRSKILRKKPW